MFSFDNTMSIQIGRKPFQGFQAISTKSTDSSRTSFHEVVNPFQGFQAISTFYPRVPVPRPVPRRKPFQGFQAISTDFFSGH